MPALIRCTIYGFIFLLFACSERQLSAEAENVGFAPAEDFKRLDVFNGSIHLPDYFVNITPKEQESFYRFAALSKDQYLEIHRISKSETTKKSLEEFAQSRIDQFTLSRDVLKATTSIALEIHKANAIAYACDAVEPGSVDEWAYWMVFVENGSDFFEVRTWTYRDRKIYFEKKANIMLHSISFQALTN